MAAIKTYLPKWNAAAKEIADGVKKTPPDYPAPHGPKLSTECQSTVGSFVKFLGCWALAEKLIDGGLSKHVGASIALAEATIKEVADFRKAVDAAKAPSALLALGTELDKELNDFVKAGKAFKDALAKFDKETE